MDKKHEIYEISDDEPTLLDKFTATNKRSKTRQNTTEGARKTNVEEQRQSVEIEDEEDVVYESDLNSEDGSAVGQTRHTQDNNQKKAHIETSVRSLDLKPTHITVSSRADAEHEHKLRLSAAPLILELDLSNLPGNQLRSMVAKASTVLVSRGNFLPRQFEISQASIQLCWKLA
jgi:hypothetical protein